MEQLPFPKQEQGIFERTSSSYLVDMSGGLQVSTKRPRSDIDDYYGNISVKQQRREPALQPSKSIDEKFTISPFRKMVVQLHAYLDRQDVVKMAYLIDLPHTFEEEMGTCRDPLLFFIQEATRAQKVNPGNVDLLIDALVILNKPEDVVKVVKDFKGEHLQPSSASDTMVWKKTPLQADPQPKTSEKDYTRYWLKFKDWCNRQNILEAEKAPCKKVVEYLNSLTSSLKLSSIMHYYKGILQYHQDFKLNEKTKLELCIKEIREQEKRTKN